MKKSLGIAIALLWIIPSMASAEVIFYQPIANDEFTRGLYYDGINDVRVDNYLPLGTGHSGIPSSLSMYLDTGLCGGTRTISVNLIESTTSATSTATGRRFSWNLEVSSASKTLVSDGAPTAFGGIAELDASKYYGITFGQSASQCIHMYGQDTAGSWVINDLDNGFGNYGNGKVGPNYLIYGDGSMASSGISVIDIDPSGGFQSIFPNPVTYAATVYIPDSAFNSTETIPVKMKVQEIGNLGTVQNPLYSGFGGVGPFGGFILNAQNQVFSHDVSQDELDDNNRFTFAITSSNFLNEVVVTVTAGDVASSSFAVIDATTTIGQLNATRSQTQANTLNTLLASSTNDVSSCGIGAFNLTGCTVALLYVQQSELNAMFMTFFSSVAEIWPLGYATRLVQILADTTATESSGLPYVIDTDLPNGTPAAGIHLRLSFFDNLLGDDSILSTATNPNTGDTLRDIVEPGWTNFVYAGTAILIALQVLGATSLLSSREMTANSIQRRFEYYN